MNRSFQKDASGGCASMAQDLVLYLYDEAGSEHRLKIEDHLKECAGCRVEIESLRATLRIVDRAGLPAMADALAQLHAPTAWEDLRARLEGRAAPGGADAGRRSIAWWMKAAAAVLIAGGSFLAGTQFPLLNRPQKAPLAGPAEIAQPAPQDAESRLRAFSEQTAGYFNRSRFVLLEIANADTSSDSTMLREITGKLLRESREARQVAGQIADRRIEQAVARLEPVLREISRVSDWGDAPSVQAIRQRVNDSGVLDELELLIPAPVRLAERRSRT
jgi:hypothetical protein